MAEEKKTMTELGIDEFAAKPYSPAPGEKPAPQEKPKQPVKEETPQKSAK
jgi:hypothetical protein